MLHKFFSPYFWVTLVALSIASGLFWLGSFRHVEGTVFLLMLPKSDTAIVAPGNAQYLISSTPFQKTLTTTLTLPKSPFDKEMLKERTWDQWLQATVLPGSSLLMITSQTQTEREGKFLLDTTVKELVHTLSQLYNFETELDVRVIDGPRFMVGVSSWPRFLGVSLGSGLLITILFFLVLSGVEYGLTRRPHRDMQEAAYRISPDTFRPKAVAPYWSREETVSPEELAEPVHPHEQEMSVYADTFTDPNPAEVIEAMQEEPEERPMIQEETVPTAEYVEPRYEEIEEREVPHRFVTGPAPDNLPISDLSPLEEANARLFKADIDATALREATLAEEELDIPAVPIPPSTTEPTQEEYKRRLNELLSGRM